MLLTDGCKVLAKLDVLCDTWAILIRGLASQVSRFLRILMGGQAGQLRLRPVLDLGTPTRFVHPPGLAFRHSQGVNCAKV